MIVSDKRVETAVILAAGMGTRLRSIIGESPKGCLSIENEALLQRSIRLLIKAGIKKLIVVKGFQGDLLEECVRSEFPNAIFVENDLFDSTGSMHSLYLAKDEVDDDFLLLESDLLYEYRALPLIIEHKYDTSVLVSGRTDAGDEVYVYGETDRIQKISKELNNQMEILGELVGIVKLSLKSYQEMIVQYKSHPQFPTLHHYEEIISELSEQQKINALKITDLVWTEIDDPEHFDRARRLVYPKILENDHVFYGI